MIALYGTVGFNLGRGEWVVQPEFLVRQVGDVKGVVQRMTDFWEEKIEECKFIKYALVMMGCTLTYLLIYKPLKSVFLRSRNKRAGMSKGDLEYFKLR